MMHPDVKKALKAMAWSQVTYVALSAATLAFPSLNLGNLIVLLALIVLIVLVIFVMPIQIEKERVRTVKAFLVLIVVLPVLAQHTILREIILFYNYGQCMILPLSIASTACVSVAISVVALQHKSIMEKKSKEFAVYFLLGLIAITIVVALDYLLGPADIMTWILGFVCGWLAPSIGRMIIMVKPIGDIWMDDVITVKGYSMQSTGGESTKSRWLMIWGRLAVLMWAAPIVAAFTGLED